MVKRLLMGGMWDKEGMYESDVKDSVVMTVRQTCTLYGVGGRWSINLYTFNDTTKVCTRGGSKQRCCCSLPDVKKDYSLPLLLLPMLTLLHRSRCYCCCRCCGIQRASRRCGWSPRWRCPWCGSTRRAGHVGSRGRRRPLVILSRYRQAHPTGHSASLPPCVPER